MSYHHCRIHLPVNAMAELWRWTVIAVVTFAKSEGSGPKLQVKHTWAGAPLEISVPLRH